MLLQSRDLKPLGRYFPELEAGLREVCPPGVVLDGEVVIAGEHGLDFEALLLRIHPAASRVRKLAEDTPSSFVAFDLLAVDGESLMETPLEARRARLERLLAQPRPPLYLTPATVERAVGQDWFERFEGAGLDGVVAKRLDQGYHPDERVLVKVKHQRTAECVVGGYRWAKDKVGEAVGSLLLGVYDASGVLHHVGHTSSFKQEERRRLVEHLRPYVDPSGQASFGQGRTPGAPSRWTQGKDLSWVSLRPERVCEVAFDHMQGDRFRHAATFLRWRPDKPAEDCSYDQFAAPVPYEVEAIFRRP
jgi:ATP-dependent DNA ligase